MFEQCCLLKPKQWAAVLGKNTFSPSSEACGFYESCLSYIWKVVLYFSWCYFSASSFRNSDRWTDTMIQWRAAESYLQHHRDHGCSFWMRCIHDHRCTEWHQLDGSLKLKLRESYENIVMWGKREKWGKPWWFSTDVISGFRFMVVQSLVEATATSWENVRFTFLHWKNRKY